MNPIAVVIRAPFIAVGLVWQTTLMLIQFVGLAYALAKLALMIVRLIWRVLGNAYYRWF
ncbi:MAG: hypothetical protein KJ725_20485 [Gammaproteobacteria bacterium]|nr:hypothetical protein [Gammaproteobacteria bacterium]